MEQIENVFMLQMAELLREISLNMLQTRQLSNPYYVTTKEAARLLGGIDQNKVVKMYKDKTCPITGVEDGKNIKILYSSIGEYVAKTQAMIQDDYFTNMQNLMKKTGVTRTEIEKYIKK